MYMVAMEAIIATGAVNHIRSSPKGSKVSAENVKWRVNRAVRSSNLPAPARLIMLTLSDMADAKTGVIPERNAPSIRQLAEETDLGESTVRVQLASLEELGWIIRSRPDAQQQARHISTGYRLQVGAAGEKRAPVKRKPRVKKESPETSSGVQDVDPAGVQEMDPGALQEMDPETESGVQEIAVRGTGDSGSGSISCTPYIKDDDPYDPYDLFAADAAPAGGVEPPEPKPRKRSGATRKAAKPKTPDPLGDIAQELTVAFIEAHGKTNAQPFPAIRGVVKATLARNVPRDVLAAAMDAVASNGFPISGATLTVELNRMWKAANGQDTSRRPGAADRIMADAREREQRYLAEEAAKSGNTPNPFELLPGTAA